MNLDIMLKLDGETVASLRTKRFALNGEDFGDAEKFRAILQSAKAIRRASINGLCVFRHAAADAHVRELFFDGAIRPWQIVAPSLGLIDGPFQVTGLEYAGEHNGEVSYAISLDAAGTLSFSATAKPADASA